MGNSFGVKSEFEQKKWRKISDNKHKVVLFNQMTNKSVEKHTAIFQIQQQDPLDICQWRQNLPSQTCVIELYEYGIKNKNLCNSQPQLYVISERIHTLQEIINFSKIQAFILIRDIAEGMIHLTKKFGHFTPRPDMFGVNIQGRGRIWISNNSASIVPDQDELPTPDSELVLLNNLIRIIKAKVSNDKNVSAEYPFNLNFRSAVRYLDQVLKNFGKYQVHKVYLDRSQYQKQVRNLNYLKQKQQSSRIFLQENAKKFEELQILHRNLKQQQIALLQKQRTLTDALKNQPQTLSGMTYSDPPTQLTRLNDVFKNTNQPMMNIHKNQRPNMSPSFNKYPSQIHNQYENSRQNRNPSFQIKQKNEYITPTPIKQLPANNIQIVDSMLVIGEKNIAQRNLMFENQPRSFYKQNN